MEVMMNKKKVPTSIIIIGLLLSLCVIITSLFWIYPFPSKDKVPYTSLKNPIIFHGEIYEEEAYIQEDVVYIPLSFFMEHIDPSAHYDEETQSIIITTEDKVYQFPVNSLNTYMNEEPFNFEVPIIVNENEQKYITLEPIAHLYDIQLIRNDESGIILIRENNEILLKGKTLEGKESERMVRKEPSIQAPYVSVLEVGEEVWIEKELDSFYFVRKTNGIAGYIQKELIEIYETELVKVDRERSTVHVNDLPWPIQLTWEAVYTFNPKTDSLPEMPGVNIVSPTWFHIDNDEGDISNLGSLEYVKWAKDRGYQIWALFANDFQDLDMTHKVFSSYETRQKMIRQLLQYSQMYELDGINLDIENVRVEDGPYITQFVREAVPYFHRAGLVVSMDITFISSSPTWSMFYEREELAKLVDYLMVMAYDEHWGTSPVAGSVASLPWVEQNLQKLLEVVPNDRLILGIPLYTRLWKEEETENGNIQVTSRAIGMEAANKWINERQLVPVIDEQSKQNYVEYYDEEEKATYKIWLEDEYSLQQRVQLIHKYQLAGIATWSRSFGNNEAWEVMKENSEQINVVSPQTKRE